RVGRGLSVPSTRKSAAARVSVEMICIPPSGPTGRDTRQGLSCQVFSGDRTVTKTPGFPGSTRATLTLPLTRADNVRMSDEGDPDQPPPPPRSTRRRFLQTG